MGLEHWETMADNNDKKTGIEIVDNDNNNDDEDEFAHLEFQRQKWCSFFAKYHRELIELIDYINSPDGIR